VLLVWAAVWAFRLSLVCFSKEGQSNLLLFFCAASVIGRILQDFVSKILNIAGYNKEKYFVTGMKNDENA